MILLQIKFNFSGFDETMDFDNVPSYIEFSDSVKSRRL